MNPIELHHQSAATGRVCMAGASRYIIATAWISALALSGCSLGASTDAEELADLLRGGWSADYEPAESPQDLASRSTLVVEGNLAGFIEGREVGRGPGMARTITMVVDVDSAFLGNAPETVYVELPSPGNARAAEYDSPSEPFPVLLYLIPADRSEDIVDADAGRPAGEPLYRPTTPQGFIAGTESGVVQILEFEQFNGASLEEFYPQSPVYPEPASLPEGG